MKKILLLSFTISSQAFCQNYTSYFTGNATDIVTAPLGGICVMGGATEHDEAMKWFLQQANGGDVLVLRASGSNGYNDYLYSDLGISVNSVETIVCANANASQDAYVQQKIEQAEAIWFAGGDQWNYVSYWRNTPVDSLINIGIAERNMVIGGTSAGMVIQGKYYFTAQNGTVTSAVALANPYNSAVTVSDQPFIKNAYLNNVITDTHYDNPDRKGRHVVFLSRIIQDNMGLGKGIACDEYTAVCIDAYGICKIYGEYPAYDEDVYFIQPNCELTDLSPEICTAATPLTWNRGGEALKVYHAKGTMNGTQTFDLNDWTSGSGGVWEHWFVENGILTQNAGTVPSCGLAEMESNVAISNYIYPNPVTSGLISLKTLDFKELRLYDAFGNAQKVEVSDNNSLDVSSLADGIYLLRLVTNQGVEVFKLQIGNY